ncbi:MAG TPA: carboxypeptidase-like regulatory domain-containing protein [Acidobacteriota bacterium]|jgi:hypothetical protein|nr:carboxypeptidase-like regulatory domain-containing protein [Acidobacteriota bacterium]
MNKIRRDFYCVSYCSTLVCALSLVLLTSFNAALAQTANTGTILDLVTDPSGSVVSGAEIQLTDLKTNQVRSLIANELGRYTGECNWWPITLVELPSG